MTSCACFLVPTNSTVSPREVVSTTAWNAWRNSLTVCCRSMMWMPLRAPKMYCFIFGFHRPVLCPKCTPASSKARMLMGFCAVASAIVSIVILPVGCHRHRHRSAETRIPGPRPLISDVVRSYPGRSGAGVSSTATAACDTLPPPKPRSAISATSWTSQHGVEAAGELRHVAAAEQHGVDRHRIELPQGHPRLPFGVQRPDLLVRAE